jgi:uncharacterized protein (TIGR03435 family)
MVKRVVIAALVALTGQAQPSFEVASVKPSPPRQEGVRRPVGCRGGPGTSDPGLFTCTDMPLSTLIMRAWGLKPYQLTRPEWMNSDRFDVAAKIPEGSANEQLRLMEESLLSERFKLALHHEEKEMPVYELTVGKSGPKFKESVAEAPRDSAAAVARSGGLDQYGCRVMPAGWAGTMATKDRRMLSARRSSIEDLATNLSNYLGSPVLNATGLTGAYDIALCWVPDGVPDADPGPTLPVALQEQLGLKLDSKRRVIDVVVIDHAEKTPIEN